MNLSVSSMCNFQYLIHSNSCSVYCVSYILTPDLLMESFLHKKEPGYAFFLHSVNLIRGVVEGKGFVRPVQALVFLETFLPRWVKLLHYLCYMV